MSADRITKFYILTNKFKGQISRVGRHSVTAVMTLTLRLNKI